MNNIPAGFCQCGCGQRTKQVTFNDNVHGYKKGDYRKFINHHNNNKNHLIPKKCVICDTEFLPRKRSRQDTQLTCSARCRNTHNSIKTAAQRAEALRGRGEGKSYPKLNGRHKHRVVMEEVLGRPLCPGEVVHHKDENIQNAAPDNLELLEGGQSEHAILHHTKNRVCEVAGCNRKHSARGFCSLHYQRLMRTGTTEPVDRRKKEWRKKEFNKKELALAGVS